MLEAEAARRTVTKTDRGLEVERNRLLQQQATVEAARIAVARAEVNLARTQIIAPQDAIVEEALVNVGGRVSKNMALGVLLPLADLEVSFRLSDSQYARLASADPPLIGREISVSWNNQLILTATITRIAPRVDVEGAGITAYARLEGLTYDTPLRLGAFLTITMDDRRFEQVIQLPESALMPDGYIYSIEADSRLVAREAEVVLRSQGDILIHSDLEAEHCVVIARFNQIGEGILVAPQGCSTLQDVSS